MLVIIVWRAMIKFVTQPEFAAHNESECCHGHRNAAPRDSTQQVIRFSPEWQKILHGPSPIEVQWSSAPLVSTSHNSAATPALCITAVPDSRSFRYCGWSTASTARSSATFRSGGRKLASIEFDASSRNCSAVNWNSLSASRYSPERSLPKS